MKLKNIVIVVNDIEKSKQFYHDLFGLDVVLERGGNVMLTEGLVLQEKKVWQGYIEKGVMPESNSCVLYFEERDVEAFAEKLEKLYPSVNYITKLTELDGGRKMMRFYDLDGNLIEVRTPGRK